MRMTKRAEIDLTRQAQAAQHAIPRAACERHKVHGWVSGCVPCRDAQTAAKARQRAALTLSGLVHLQATRSTEATPA